MAKEKETKNMKAEKSVSPVGTRGRVFEGTVAKKFPMRAVIETERTVYHHKLERFSKKMTRLHARVPAGLDVNVGDYVRIRECRPLSKIISFVVIGIVRKHEVKEAVK